MFTEKQESDFLEWFSLRKINDFKAIAEEEGMNGPDVARLAKKKYGTVYAYIGITKLALSSREESKALYDKLKDRIAAIQLISEKFFNNKHRMEGFGSFDKFYHWYKDEPRECFYCGLTEADSALYYELIKEDRTKYGKGDSTRGKTLEIDRKENKKGYNGENCEIACYYCNNAKSDVFEWQIFKRNIAPQIRTIISAALTG